MRPFIKLKLVFIIFGAILIAGVHAVCFAEEPQPVQRLRDPMVPQEMSIFQKAKKEAVKRVEKSSFQVQGVGRGPRGAYVIIDGQAYAEGENKGGITVVKIGETSVDILSDGITETLPIKKR